MKLFWVVFGVCSAQNYVVLKCSYSINMKQDRSFPLSILKRQIAVLSSSMSTFSMQSFIQHRRSLREQSLKYSLRLQVSQGCPLQNKKAFALVVIAVNSVETLVVLDPNSGSHGKTSLFWRPSPLFLMKISKELFCIHYALTQEEAQVMPYPSCVWS